jgi:N-acetylmuramoyl-L-alanine amidase
MARRSPVPRTLHPVPFRKRRFRLRRSRQTPPGRLVLPLLLALAACFVSFRGCAAQTPLPKGQLVFLRAGQIVPAGDLPADAPPRARLETLLRGPAPGSGLTSLLPPDTRIEGLALDNRELRVNLASPGFDRLTARGARDLLVAQVARALVGSEVRRLVLSLNGTPERALLWVEFPHMPLAPHRRAFDPEPSGPLYALAPDGNRRREWRPALLNKHIVLSPGHGYYKNPAGEWVLQRPWLYGIVEDFINLDMVRRLDRYLREAGAVTYPTRDLDPWGPIGVSGKPRWQESALQYLEAIGGPPKEFIRPYTDEYAADISCRPLYANWVGADLTVSIHNNASRQQGSLTLYDTTNGQQTESRRLAEGVHNRLLAVLRKEFVPTWGDHGAKGFDANYGENHWAQMPSVLVEAAFMDTPEPDNRLLKTEAFRDAVARAIYEGICAYYGVLPTYPEHPEPLEPLEMPAPPIP